MAETAVRNKPSRADAANREPTAGVVYTPRVDIVETDQELVLYADMPGVKPDGLDLRFENGELALHGRCPPRSPGGDCLLQEYGVGDYHRLFTVSQDVDADKITATLQNGVLTLRLPKAEAAKPRRIPVQAP